MTRVEEVWRITEEWWRGEPLVRTYYRLLMDDGRVITCFQDHADIMSGWYEQRY